MPGRYRVKLVATTVHVVPAAGGTHTTVAAPSGKSFPVETDITLSLENKAGGTPPLRRGEKRPARIELMGRLAPAPAATATARYTFMAALDGEVELRFNASHTPPEFPFFRCLDPAKKRTDFVDDPGPLIASSDWVIDLRFDPDSFDPPLNKPSRARLPWLFEDPKTAQPKMQVNARLTIAGVIETDVTGPDANTPIEIHLQHSSVPHDGRAGAPATNPLLTFFGVRNLYPLANDKLADGTRVAFAGLTLNVFLHASAAAFITGAGPTVAAVAALIGRAFTDAGMARVNVDAGAAAVTNFATNFKQRPPTGGGAAIFMSVNIPAAGEQAFVDTIAANRNPVVGDGASVILPFFDFYIVSQAVDPPAGSAELAHSERLDPVRGSVGGIFQAAATKAILTPIVITEGASRTSGMRKSLSQCESADRVNLLASTIVHEIGHTLGLRHALGFNGAPPYATTASNAIGRGVMATPTLQLGANNLAPFPVQLFGPVHALAIRQRFL